MLIMELKRKKRMSQQNIEYIIAHFQNFWRICKRIKQHKESDHSSTYKNRIRFHIAYGKFCFIEAEYSNIFEYRGKKILQS